VLSDFSVPPDGDSPRNTESLQKFRDFFQNSWKGVEVPNLADHTGLAWHSLTSFFKGSHPRLIVLLELDRTASSLESSSLARVRLQLHFFFQLTSSGIHGINPKGGSPPSPVFSFLS
jgi:hypothetical protein